MLRKFLLCRLVLLWLLLVAQAAIAATERGLLWQIEQPQGRVSYLFGTIHTDDARVNNFSPRLEAALASADNFMLEVLPPRDPAVLFLPQKTLRELLDQKAIDAVMQQADIHAIQSDVALRMKPWLLAAVFVQPRAPSPLFQDMQLLGMAIGKGKPVQPLEDSAVHFGALDGLEIDEQLTMLHAVLALSQEEKEQGFEALVQTYLSADSTRIAAFDEAFSSKGLPPGLWLRVRAMLLDKRNEQMAERILRQIGKGSTFVAVGAAHLPGKGGLIERLRNAGYRLSAVE